MVSTRMAQQILPHCPEGPALDILTSAAVNIPTLKASPSADVIRKRIKAGVSLNSLIALVEATNSPEILSEIVKRDKRLSVKRAAAKNAALSEEDVQKIKDVAIQNNDMKTLVALWEGRDLAGKVALLQENYALGWHVPNWSHTFASAIQQHGDEALEYLEKHLETSKLRSVLTTICEGRYPLKGSAVKLAEAIATHDPTVLEDRYRNTGRLAETLIKVEDGADTWRAVLKLLPNMVLVLKVIEVSSRSEEKLPQEELLTYAKENRDVEHIMSALSNCHIPLEAVTVRRALLIPGLPSRTLTRGVLTPEACELLVRNGNTMILGAQLANLPVVKQRQYLEEIEDLIEHVELRAEAVLALRAEGIQEELFWKLARKAVGRYGDLRNEELRNLIIVEGPIEILALLTLEVDELEKAMGRPDRELVMPTVARRLLGNVSDLPEETRREAQLALTGEEDVAWCVRSLREGDLTHYLERCTPEQRAEIIDAIRYKVRVSDLGYWGPEAVRTLPLEWKDISNPHAVHTMLEVLTDEFGEDRDKWQTGLTLLAEWTGTLDELVETVELL